MDFMLLFLLVVLPERSSFCGGAKGMFEVGLANKAQQPQAVGNKAKGDFHDGRGG
jgi:hypothetical protein